MRQLVETATTRHTTPLPRVRTACKRKSARRRRVGFARVLLVAGVLLAGRPGVVGFARVGAALGDGAGIAAGGRNGAVGS